MSFDLFRANDLRNLTNCEIRPHERVNLIHGKNGSGKTSILEAIYILCRGKSFRDRQLVNVIQRGKQQFTVFGIKQKNQNKTKIGLSYSKEGAKVKMDGEIVNKLSTLVKETPLHIITPKSQEIIENGSSIRRRFVDWGVFHVEPSYQQFSARYQRALIQRNRALRELPKTAAIWDRELIDSGEKIQEFRNNYFKILKSHFFNKLDLLNIDVDVDMNFNKGWSLEKPLEKVLQESLAGDIRRKYTRYGPHRADIKFGVNNRELDKWSSRGQMKLITYCLFSAQASVIKYLSEKESVLLVDDFAAELDKENIKKITSFFNELENQTFLTTTDDSLSLPAASGKMFHVERGALFEVGV